MAYVNENEEVNTINQDTEEEVEVDTKFLDTKNCYEKYILFVKLAFHNYFSFLKRKEYIRECDAEEFLKSENTEEFQNQKMRLQNSLKEDLFTSSGDYDFILKSYEIYFWKQIGLFN